MNNYFSFSSITQISKYLLVAFLIALLLFFGVGMVWFLFAELAFSSHFNNLQSITIEGRVIERIYFVLIFLIGFFVRKKIKYLSLDSNLTPANKVYYSVEASTVISLSVIGAFFLAFGLQFVAINADSGIFSEFSTVIHQFFYIGIVNNVMISLGEEMVYRGLIFTYLLHKTSELKLSIIISSFVFSLMHFNYSEPISFILAFTGGVIFAYAYYSTKTLLIPISMHFSYNFFMEIFKSEEKDYLIKILKTDIYYFTNLGDSFDVIRLLFLLFVGFYVVKRFPKIMS